MNKIFFLGFGGFLLATNVFAAGTPFNSPRVSTMIPRVSSSDNVSLGNVTRDKCVLSIEVNVVKTAIVATDFDLEVWDDGEKTGDYSVPAGGPGVLIVKHVLDRNVGTEKVGLDFGLETSTGSKVDYIANWDFPNSDRVLEFCKKSDGKDDGAGVTVPVASPAQPVPVLGGLGLALLSTLLVGFAVIRRRSL